MTFLAHKLGMCAGRIFSIPRPTLADCPLIVDLWHPSKNGGSKPTDFLCGTKRRVWLQCNGCVRCGEVHEWDAFPFNLSKAGSAGRDTLCPACRSMGSFCSCRALSKNKSLLREWHEDNPPAETISMGSDKKFKWRCSVKSCAHVWEAQPCWRTRGTGCPKCSTKHRRLGAAQTNGLAERRPDLLAEWDEAKNNCSAGDVSCGSGRTVWWCCQKCGDCWQTRIERRLKQRPGCQKCRMKE